MTANTKIIFFINKKSISSQLTKLFTGCYCYHVGILIGNKVYDMKWTRRRYTFPRAKDAGDTILVVDSPVQINEDYLIGKILNDNKTYGFKDYLLFGLRPVYHFFGKATRNEDGLICSEQVNNDLINSGWDSPYPKDLAPPSPCDLYKTLTDLKLKVREIKP